MRSRTAPLALAVVAIASAAGAGCRRSAIPEQAGQDAAASDALTADDRPGPPVEAGQEAAPDLAVIPDAADSPAGDAPGDGAMRDTPADMAPVDTPADMSAVDRSPETARPDQAAADGSDVRPDEQPCGPAGFVCNPYRCDVALGRCKTSCASDDDCIGRPCTRNSCGFDLPAPCASNTECASGFCAQGACCSTACSTLCFSCAVPGSRGACVYVPHGNPDPAGNCPTGYACNGRGECIPPTCAVDTDCGPFHRCPTGRCVPCSPTCFSSADCVGGTTCTNQNGCTYCGFPDAGAGG